MNKIKESVICAGFGGQGIMILGKVLATAGMNAGLNVTWLPAYGVEVRGGTAYSMVVMSSSPVASPVVTNADTAIIMNGPSLEKFENTVKKGGILILNTSVSTRRALRGDIEKIEVPLTEEAIKLGNPKVANMIAAGVFMSRKKLFDKATMESVFIEMTAGREELIKINIKAIDRGMELGMKG